MKPRISWLLAPGIAYLLVIYLLPIGMTLHSPFQNGLGEGLSSIWEALQDPGYQRVLLITFEVALEVTIIAILLGYPTAYFLSRAAGTRRQVSANGDVSVAHQSAGAHLRLDRLAAGQRHR